MALILLFSLHFAGLQVYPHKYLGYPDIIGFWGNLPLWFSFKCFFFILFISLSSYTLLLYDDKVRCSPRELLDIITMAIVICLNRLFYKNIFLVDVHTFILRPLIFRVFFTSTPPTNDTLFFAPEAKSNKKKPSGVFRWGTLSPRPPFV